jgi:hypothetical protein
MDSSSFGAVAFDVSGASPGCRMGADGCPIDVSVTNIKFLP